MFLDFLGSLLPNDFAENKNLILNYFVFLPIKLLAVNSYLLEFWEMYYYVSE